MKRTYTVGLSVDEINNLIKELGNYKNNILPNLIERFVSELADVGIYTGRITIQSDKAARKYVVFSKQFERTDNGVQGMILATETGHITSRWMTLEGMKEADVSPLLMTEWGSGKFASGYEISYPDGVKGGRGTFPGQIHAFDPEGWYWYDELGELHHSYGWEPSRPVFHAWAEMDKAIITVARRVFNS